MPVDIEKLNAILANWINTPNEMHPPNLLSASEREITRRVACPETCFWCSPNEFFIVAAGGGRWAPSPGPRLFLYGPGGSGKSTLAYEFARLPSKQLSSSLFPEETR